MGISDRPTMPHNRQNLHFYFFAIEDLVFHNPRDCGSIVDNLQYKYNWYRLTWIAFRFCLLAHRPPQSLKLQRHQGKHDGDCRPLQKRQRVDGPQVLVPKMRRQSAYSDAMPSAFCLRHMAFNHGLRPAASGLRPAACGLRPAASGLRPAACGLRPTAFGLQLH